MPSTQRPLFDWALWPLACCRREIGINDNDVRRVLLTDATYRPFGAVAGWTFGNGLVLRRSFDANGLPVAVEDGPESGGGSVGLALGYRFDAAGNLVRLRSGRANDPAAVSQTYAYDGLDRLTGAGRSRTTTPTA